MGSEVYPPPARRPHPTYEESPEHMRVQRPRCGGDTWVKEYDPESGRWVPQTTETGEPLTRPCGNFSVRGSDPPRCLPHMITPERRRRMVVSRISRITGNANEVAEILGSVDLPDLHPMDALLEVVRYSGAMMRMLGALVGELPVDPTVLERDEAGKVTASSAGLWGYDTDGDAAPNVLVQLYGVWTDRHLGACERALKAGIDERLVRNAESTGSRFLEIFDRVLTRAALTEDLRLRLARDMAREIREMMLGGHVTALDAGSTVKDAALQITQRNLRVDDGTFDAGE